ncbi:beta-lactamase/transpeptidase-like protein [Crucibulum laeve]|uniref:Beta-lactamase/transpeptidase-like protein n=1 Tax=Crucibulum laeve TaxID=68775 RepID=A0A5C3M6A6_9AGAR|nr:beta-lactamase/transpeptidase-like protein [Crucibulum laeve]
MDSNKTPQHDALGYAAAVNQQQDRSRRKKQMLIGLVCTAIALLAVAWHYGVTVTFSMSISTPKHHQSFNSNTKLTCRFPLPNLLTHSPPLYHEELKKASKRLDKYLSKRVLDDDIDSIAIAVVTPAGTVFERGYGVLRPNETTAQRRGTIDANSIYRIASVTKMFTVLETLILRERGILNWDDPVEKFMPELSYPSYGWSDYMSGNKLTSYTDEMPPITLRQLASHMAGIGRDYPPKYHINWPNTDSPPWDSPLSLPVSSESLLSAIAKYPLVNSPYGYPVYSNAGFDLLGLANVAANLNASESRDKEPQSHKELVKRDIFDPLGLNSSFYRMPADSSLRGRIAIPSRGHGFTDILYTDASDPAGGQYSSLADLITVMKTFLSPTAKSGVVSEHVMREWLRPIHEWTGSGSKEQVGAPWEITKLPDNTPVYNKGGDIDGYVSLFSLNPQYGYGLVLLATGNTTVGIANKAFNSFQPAFETILQEQVRRAYVGEWVDYDNTAVVSIIEGALYLEKLVVRGVDVLSLVQGIKPDDPKTKTVPVALWSLNRRGEFRLAFGPPGYPDLEGCLRYWAAIDRSYGKGAPIDVIYWEGDELVYPSAGVRFRRG